MNKFYAGIGSRQTPDSVVNQMIALAKRLAGRGYCLRSGAAQGADSAFETGCDLVSGPKEIWLPWPDFNGHVDTGFYPEDAHYEKAATLHPAWEKLSRGPRSLHARNSGQVSGRDLKTHVSFVLCWTADGCESDATRTRDTGGTGTAIALASRLGIPVFNLGRAGSYERFVEYVLAADREFHPDGELPLNREIFVFGSNLAGRHGKGSALAAQEKFGAIYGQGEGPQGKSYAIPTKDGRPGAPRLTDPAATLSLADIKASVVKFIAYVKAKPDERFYVVRLGCDLAAHKDADIAPMFAMAPNNCIFPENWKPWLGLEEPAKVQVLDAAAGINIYSGTLGLGGALTNMTDRALEKQRIKHAYPVKVGEVDYIDVESAYQALKVAGQHDYNDGLMVDLICLKFKRHTKLFDLVKQCGGEKWLERCSHLTGAKSASFQSWEGQGVESRFIRNLIVGFNKAVTGRGATTRVVHVKEAPFDVYIGRANGNLPESDWYNPFVIGVDGLRVDVVSACAEHIQNQPALLARIGELKGKTLACWCKGRKTLTELCHGDVLASWAEGLDWTPPVAPQSSLF